MPDEIESSVDRALARLDAKPGFSLKCWHCGHESPVDLGDPLKREYGCSECGATTAYGEPQPRCFILPHVDRRFLVLKFADEKKGAPEHGVTLVLARGYAAALALEVLSVTEPAAYRALERIFAAQAASGSPPPPKDDSRAGSGPATDTAADMALELDPGRNPGSVLPTFP